MPPLSPPTPGALMIALPNYGHAFIRPSPKLSCLHRVAYWMPFAKLCCASLEARIVLSPSSHSSSYFLQKKGRALL